MHAPWGVYFYFIWSAKFVIVSYFSDKSITEIQNLFMVLDSNGLIYIKTDIVL